MSSVGGGHLGAFSSAATESSAFGGSGSYPVSNMTVLGAINVASSASIDLRCVSSDEPVEAGVNMVVTAVASVAPPAS